MADITRFDPIGEMVSLRSAMDRLFEDSVVSPTGWRTIGAGDSITPPLHGVLTLRIPKSEEVKPRQIRINAGVTETSENGSRA